MADGIDITSLITSLFDTGSKIGDTASKNSQNNDNANGMYQIEKKEVQTPKLIEAKTSDERLKRVFGTNEDAIKAFSKIDSIMFEYNEKAHEIHPDGEKGIDNDTHYGVKAQDLANNPLTESAVSEDENGFLQVDTNELTMANTSLLSEVCRRLLRIEKALGLEN